LRYEDYGDEGGDELSPKISLGWQPDNSFSVIASASTGFRQPSLSQLLGGGIVTLEEVSENGGAPQFTAIRPSSNDELSPETSTAYGLNLIYRPVPEWAFGLDLWHFDIEDVIISENAQAIVSANGADPRIQRSLINTIEYIDVTYINSGEVSTNGIDISLEYTHDFDTLGVFKIASESTYINKYELRDASSSSNDTIDAVGSRNFTNFARSLPEIRSNLVANWSVQKHMLTLSLHYIHDYENDQYYAGATKENRKIESWTTSNIQYAYGMSFNEQSLKLRVGLNNLEDKEPPAVQTNMGFDTKVHDPRGRIFYVGFELDL